MRRMRRAHRSRVPGLAALARDARARHRGARSEPLAVTPDSRCQTAQCCSFPRRVAAPGFVGLFAFCLRLTSAGQATGASAPAAVATAAIPSPRRGVMERRQAHSFFRSRLRRATTGRPGPLSALHRGGFRMRTHEAGSRQWDRSPQRLPAPRRNGLAVGVRTSLRCGSRRVRGTPLLAPSFRIVSRKRPLRARMQIIYYKFIT
jgi:hypothetical protein